MSKTQIRIHNLYAKYRFIKIYFIIYAIIIVLIIPSLIHSQVIYTQQDAEICKAKFNLALNKNLSSKPINEILIEIAKSFVGTNYVAHTLDKYDEEKLIINLTGLDCYTFLESSLVFARCIKKGINNIDSSRWFGNYAKELESIRYRNGKLNNYPSRLHYFSDWIYEMNKRNIGKDITKEIGGEPYKKKINFMSTHIDSYPVLKGNKKFIDDIINIEKEISSRDYYYIPQNKIEIIEDKIQSGDIIGITTNIDGLDIVHTGIAIRMEDGRIHLLHAPNVGYKVQITEKPLSEYIKYNKKQNGIMVLRIL